MTFREKSAWVVLLGMGAVLWRYLASLREAGSFGAGTTQVMFLTILAFVVFAVIAHTLMAILSAKSGDDAEDERDRQIARKSEYIAGYVLGAFALGGLAFALMEGAYLVANILFVGLVFSEIVKNAWQVFLYRRSA